MAKQPIHSPGTFPAQFDQLRFNLKTARIPEQSFITGLAEEFGWKVRELLESVNTLPELIERLDSLSNPQANHLLAHCRERYEVGIQLLNSFSKLTQEEGSSENIVELISPYFSDERQGEMEKIDNKNFIEFIFSQNIETMKDIAQILREAIENKDRR